MPVTLPAHPAAILPLRRVLPALPLTALVVGSTAPDLAYPLGMYSNLSHTFPGILLFCLPVGLLAVLWTEWLLLPVWRATLPRIGRVELARFARSEGVPATARAWGLAALAVLLGALTHVLWDGVTHRSRWPASVFVAGLPLHRQFLICDSLQLGFSLLGSVVVVAAMARAYPALRPTGVIPRTALLWVWLLPTALAFSLGFGWRAVHTHVAGLQGQLWYEFWTGMSGALAVLTLTCLALRLGPLRGLKAPGDAAAERVSA